MGLNGKLSLPEVAGEGVVLIPFSFTINGTSTPDGLGGDYLVSVAYTAAGRFTCTLRDQPYACLVGVADVSESGNTTDMYARVDWSGLASGKTFVVRTMTGSTETTPTDNVKVGGVLVCLKTNRTAG
jgi:hypothetical protein